MCYGGLDPKYMMRDIEARMKTAPLAAVGDTKPKPALVPGLMVWVRAARDWALRKDPEHV
jgi:hypothetical protein